MKTDNVITDAEYWFENHKRSFSGINAGDFIDKEDFLSYTNYQQQINDSLLNALKMVRDMNTWQKYFSGGAIDKKLEEAIKKAEE